MKNKNEKEEQDCDHDENTTKDEEDKPKMICENKTQEKIEDEEDEETKQLLQEDAQLESLQKMLKTAQQENTNHPHPSTLSTTSNNQKDNEINNHQQTKTNGVSLPPWVP